MIRERQPDLRHHVYDSGGQQSGQRDRAGRRQPRLYGQPDRSNRDHREPDQPHGGKDVDGRYRSPAHRGLHPEFTVTARSTWPRRTAHTSPSSAPIWTLWTPRYWWRATSWMCASPPERIERQQQRIQPQSWLRPALQSAAARNAIHLRSKLHAGRLSGTAVTHFQASAAGKQPKGHSS